MTSAKRLPLRQLASPLLLKVIGKRNRNTRGVAKLVSAQEYLREQRRGYAEINREMMDNASSILTLNTALRGLIHERHHLGVELWKEMERLERKRT